MLFSKLSETGVTTFYDSVCGLPLFKAPFGRTLQEFQADTQAHGWPSFRPEEVGRPSSGDAGWPACNTSTKGYSRTLSR